MLIQTLVYNAALVLFDRVALRYLSKRRTAGAAAVALSIVWSTALVLAVLLSFERFSAMRLFAWGLFAHGAVVLVIGGLHLRPAARALGRSA